jgi:hypothetical protein
MERINSDPTTPLKNDSFIELEELRKKGTPTLAAPSQPLPAWRGGQINHGGTINDKGNARYLGTKTSAAGALPAIGIAGTIGTATVGTSAGLREVKNSLSEVPVLGRAADVLKDVFDWTVNPLTGGIITAAPYIGYRLGREALDAAGILEKSNIDLTPDPVSLSGELAKVLGHPAEEPPTKQLRGSKRAALDEPPTRSLRKR